MPTKDWSQIKDKLDQTLISGANVKKLGMKECPACKRQYEKDAKNIVCKHDGTLLMTSFLNQANVREAINEGLLKQHYEPIEYMGEGDLCYAFEAIDTKSKAPLVVKVIKPEVIGAPHRVQKFAKTLHEVIELQHTNIVTVINSGIVGLPTSMPAYVYLVVEKLRAANLKQVLHDFGPLTPYMVVQLMEQVCMTLDYAQKHGWLHQNLKPSNIYISSNNGYMTVKLCDFGIAERMFKHLQFSNDNTKTMSVYGNTGYIAPEVGFSGQPHTAQSEIYSLGCLMYHLLKGAPPFEGWNDFSALLMHKDKQPMPFPAELNVPPKLEGVVLKCLAKKPEDRYQSFDELNQALILSVS